MSQFYGFDQATELPSVRLWDPRLGDSLERRWKGRPTAIDAKEAELRAAGIRFRRESATPGGYSVIAAVYGAEETQPPDEPLAVLWDLDGSEIEKSIWKAPRVKEEMAKLAAVNGSADGMLASLVGIRNDVESIVNGVTESHDPETGSQRFDPLTLPRFMAILVAVNQKYFGGTPQGAIKLDVFRSLFYALSTGEDTFVTGDWVLRQRKILAKNSTIQPDILNINKVFTTTDHLVTVEGVPVNDLPFTLPEGKWLKKRPRRHQIAADKWELVQEWDYSEWYSNLAYDQAVSYPP